jgi:hypothetical protein
MAHQPDAASAKKTLKGLAYAGGIGGHAWVCFYCLLACPPASHRPVALRTVAHQPSCPYDNIIWPLRVCCCACAALGALKYGYHMGDNALISIFPQVGGPTDG